MSLFKTTIDLYWTSEGDFSLDEDKNDLEDTSLHQYRGMLQRINTNIQSSPEDWLAQPEIGAGLSRMMGMPNNAETARVIALRIQNALTSASLLRADEYNIDVFPFSENVLVAIVSITPAGTSARFILSYSYDLRYDQLVPRSI